MIAPKRESHHAGSGRFVGSSVSGLQGVLAVVRDLLGRLRWPEELDNVDSAGA